jgi:hypothetical protein
MNIRANEKCPTNALRKTAVGLAALALSSVFYPLSATAEKYKQSALPELKVAIEALEDARHSDRPFAHLENARKHLQNVNPAPNGSLAKALNDIAEAEVDAHNSDLPHMNLRITKAIGEIRSTM